MKKTYRIGILGAGMMGKTHAWCWRSLPFFYAGLPFRIELHGVCTSRPETAEAARDAYGFARTYASASELIRDPAIDLVDIATPNLLHAGAILDAVRSGKPVYCDKPLTGDIDQALQLERDVPDLESRGQMTFHCRFFPATMRARQIAESGELGEVISFRAAYLHSGNVAPGKPMHWKDLRSHGGGVLYDLGSHVVDLVTWICGSEIVEAHSLQRTLHQMRPSHADPTVQAEQDTDDMTLSLVTLANGAPGAIEASKIATGAQDELRFEIHGTKGAIRFNLMDPNYLDWFDASDPEMPLGGTSGYKRIHCVRRYAAPAGFPSAKATIGWLRGHLDCIYSFVSSVHDARPFEPSLARGVEVEKMLERMRAGVHLSRPA